MRPSRPRCAISAWRPAAAIAVALVLAGCTLGPPAPDDIGATSAYSGIKRDGQKGAKPDPAPTAALPAERPAPEAPIDSDPQRLIGLDRGALVSLLGDPVFRRQDAPAELWRYRADLCNLDVFLYGPEKAAVADKRLLVRHVEARANGDGAVSPNDCLRVLLRARLARQTS